jgi:prepilin-type N-terminal cleavage/methylation domain-containing protein
MQKKNNNGFTLAEIIIAIGIFGILASIALPNYFNWLPNIHLRTTARDIFLSLQQAKLKAAKENTCSSVAFTLTDLTVIPNIVGKFIVFTDDGEGSGGIACNGIQDGTEQTVSSNEMMNDIILESANNIGGPQSVCFSSTSVICGSQMGNIQIRNTARWHKITISSSGGIRQETSNDGTNWSN